MKQVPSLKPLDDAQMALLVTFVGQRGMRVKLLDQRHMMQLTDRPFFNHL